MPLTARLSLSVPPAVKITSDGRAPSLSAISSRDSSIRRRAARPAGVQRRGVADRAQHSRHRLDGGGVHRGGGGVIQVDHDAPHDTGQRRRCHKRLPGPPGLGSRAARQPTVRPYADFTCAAASAAFWRSSALAAPLRQLCAMDFDMGSGKMSSSPFSTPSRMAPRDGNRRCLGYVESSRHIGVHRAGQDRVNSHAPAGQKGPHRLGQGKRGGLGDRIGGNERQRGQRVNRKIVDDSSPRPGQQWQTSLDHVVGAEQVDGEVTFQHGAIGQVVVERHAGVVDQDIQRFENRRFAQATSTCP